MFSKILLAIIFFFYYNPPSKLSKEGVFDRPGVAGSVNYAVIAGALKNRFFTS